jgi:hypothetical protein
MRVVEQYEAAKAAGQDPEAEARLAWRARRMMAWHNPTALAQVAFDDWPTAIATISADAAKAGAEEEEEKQQRQQQQQQEPNMLPGSGPDPESAPAHQLTTKSEFAI